MRRKVGESMGWGFTLAAWVVAPACAMLTRPRWEGVEHIRRQRGAVVAANHISHVDPLTFAHFVYGQDRLPRFLAKSELFEVFFIRRVMRSMGQIPVYRLTSDATLAFRAAVEAVQQGKIVIVYPEGTLTRDPDLWPMRGKTGAARIALAAGVPVVPAAQWGAQEILYPYSSKLRILPRKTVVARAGAPVDLDALRGLPLTPEVLEEATNRILDDITGLLAQIRGEEPPATRFDPRGSGLRQIGNPHRDSTRRRAWWRLKRRNP